MRFATFFGGLALVIGSLAGCAEQDESVEQTKGALTTNVFKLHNYQTDYCLGVTAGKTGIGTPFVTWDCTANTPNQNFQKRAMSFVPSPYVELVNFVASDRCVMPIWPGNGQNVDTFGCESFDGGSDQKWDNWNPIYSFSSLGKDNQWHECYYFDSELEPGKVIGVSGGRTDRGAPVIMWDNFNDSVNHPDQLWCVY